MIDNKKISIIITLLNDKRFERTLNSILKQAVEVDEIIIADGGSTDGSLDLAYKLSESNPKIRVLKAPGNIPQSRNVAIQQASGDYIIFIDADEVAPEQWLEKLIEPLRDEKVGFAGGPTPGLKASCKTIGAKYYSAYLDYLYDSIASKNVYALPMGNSAWKKSLFQNVGKLDERGYYYAPGEDHDFAVRTLQKGYTGKYVKSAFVYHDYSNFTVKSVLKKQVKYARGGYKVYKKHGTTYESTFLKIVPYILWPVLLLFGSIFFIFNFEFWKYFVLSGLLIPFIMVIYYTVEGYHLEKKYPGMKYRIIEILRRYAVLYGAFLGLISKK